MKKGDCRACYVMRVCLAWLLFIFQLLESCNRDQKSCMYLLQICLHLACSWVQGKARRVQNAIHSAWKHGALMQHAWEHFLLGVIMVQQMFSASAIDAMAQCDGVDATIFAIYCRLAFLVVVRVASSAFRTVQYCCDCIQVYCLKRQQVIRSNLSGIRCMVWLIRDKRAWILVWTHSCSNALAALR